MSVSERIESRGITRVVRLTDDALLRGLSDIKGHLAATTSGGTTVLVLDVSELERLSSTTLAAMLWARRTCYARGGRVVVRGPNRRCRDVLIRTGLSSLFDIRPAHSRTQQMSTP
jgi:anti-anti-sigma factor